MKKEARKLYTACKENLCCALVSRADEHIDWVKCASRSDIVRLFCSSSVVHETSCYVVCTNGVRVECIDAMCSGGLCGFVESLVEELYRLLGGRVKGVES